MLKSFGKRQINVRKKQHQTSRKIICKTIENNLNYQLKLAKNAKILLRLLRYIFNTRLAEREVSLFCNFTENLNFSFVYKISHI